MLAPHFALCTLHFTVHAPSAPALHTSRRPLSFCAFCSAPNSPHPRSALGSLHFTSHILHLNFQVLHGSPHSTVHAFTSHCTLPTAQCHSTPTRSTLYTCNPHPKLHCLRSTPRTLHFPPRPPPNPNILCPTLWLL